MSEETKNDSIDEVEEMTSEDVDAQADDDASVASVSELSEASEEPEVDEEESDEDADSEDEEASDEEASDDDAEEASDDAEEATDDDEASDEADADDEAADDDEEVSDEADSDDEAEEASDEADADDEAADDAEEAADDADEVDVEVATTAEDGEADEFAGELLTGDHVAGVAAFFDHPDHLMYAAAQTRDSEYEAFDALSPFPIHGMDDALGVGRSWIPWVTFGAGCAGFSTAVGLQFGIMGFDWPMNFGGKPFIAWPSFVPIMFELTVLFAGVITGLVMLKAAGCFQKAFVIDTEITNDRFVLWISADDEHFDRDGVVEFMKELHPSEIRTIKKEA